MRLLRVMSVLVRQHYTLLSTECEIFLSMLVKFLDADKPMWLRVIAIEVLHAITADPPSLRSFCEYYDMQAHSTKIFRDMVRLGRALFLSHPGHSRPALISRCYSRQVNAIGGFMQSLFQTTEKDKLSIVPTPPDHGVYLAMLDKSEPPSVG